VKDVHSVQAKCGLIPVKGSNVKYGLWRALKTIGVALVLGMSMSACSESWKEEVPLSDGRVIIVERKKINEAGGDEWAFNRSGSKPKEYRMRFDDPGGSGKVIEWRSIRISPQTWPEVPLVLDMVDGKPTVFTLLGNYGCEEFFKYVYENGAWASEPLPDKFEKHKTNLLFGEKKNLPGFVDLEEKRKRNGGMYRDTLKQVGPVRKVCGQ